MRWAITFPFESYYNDTKVSTSLFSLIDGSVKMTCADVFLEWGREYTYLANIRTTEGRSKGIHKRRGW